MFSLNPDNLDDNAGSGIRRRPIGPRGPLIPAGPPDGPPMDGPPILDKPPAEQPTGPLPPVFDPTGNSDGPRDRPTGGAPPVLNQPGGISQAPSRPSPMPSSPTPSMPDSPSPSAAEPPRPFTPLDPTMTTSQTALPAVPATIQRRTVPGGPSMRSQNLLGNAGGLLGGGLGVAGNAGGQDPQSLADAIYQILLMKNGGGSGGAY